MFLILFQQVANDTLTSCRRDVRDIAAEDESDKVKSPKTSKRSALRQLRLGYVASAGREEGINQSGCMLQTSSDRLAWSDPDNKFSQDVTNNLNTNMDSIKKQSVISHPLNCDNGTSAFQSTLHGVNNISRDQFDILRNKNNGYSCKSLELTDIAKGKVERDFNVVSENVEGLQLTTKESIAPVEKNMESSVTFMIDYTENNAEKLCMGPPESDTVQPSITENENGSVPEKTDVNANSKPVITLESLSIKKTAGEVKIGMTKAPSVPKMAAVTDMLLTRTRSRNNLTVPKNGKLDGGDIRKSHSSAALTSHSLPRPRSGVFDPNAPLTPFQGGQLTERDEENLTFLFNHSKDEKISMKFLDLHSGMWPSGMSVFMGTVVGCFLALIVRSVMYAYEHI